MKSSAVRKTMERSRNAVSRSTGMWWRDAVPDPATVTRADERGNPLATSPRVLVLTHLLLFGSGACALIDQVVWLRQLRLVFGASTQATAGVLAVFMAGIAFGSARLARVAGGHPRPLRLYGLLELGIAAGALATLPLQFGAARAYVALGGTQALGPVAGPAVQLLLATLVLGVPAFLMGGTLPAAARAVEWDDDPARRRVARIYGINTLGAVSGALLATFVLLERLGGRDTLLLAVAVNLVVALGALVLARTAARRGPDLEIAGSPGASSPADEASSHGLVLGVAATAGCVFFVMELVWYRMLGPLLGGSTYTFGLILATALLGIGAGSALYALGPSNRPPPRVLLGATLALEALGLGIPFALGDRLAVVAVMLRAFEGFGFGGLVAGWCVIAACVVLPAAVVAGYQFPVLIALMRRARGSASRDTGALYAWNTLGAIAGSLAGGFGLIPLLSAPGAWRMCTIVLAALASATCFAERGRHAARAAVMAGAIAAVLVVALSMGPTAAWRHSGIGAGRRSPELASSPNQITELLHGYRAGLAWEADGRESAVGMLSSDGLSVIVGGKSDGNAIGDAGTQVMVGLLGAFLHPHPRNGLVIGLGTGSTAGWLAAVPSMERVDVVELEPAVAHIARACVAVNHGALGNPKVRLRFGDGRDALLTSRRRYDVIASEPSNPYRAGVASLYTRELYRAARSHLAPGGIFLQWVQGYELDVTTLSTVYATLSGVFPHVVTWAPLHGDLLLVASEAPLREDVATLRARLMQEPYASAFRDAWRVTSLEGVLARYVGNEDLTTRLSSRGHANTDDNMSLEYDFARHVGVHGTVDTDALSSVARLFGATDPGWIGPIDSSAVAAQRITEFVTEGQRPPLASAGDPLALQVEMGRDFMDENYEQVRRSLVGFRGAVHDVTELAMLGETLADAGDPSAAPIIARLATLRPAEAAFLTARLRLRTGDAPGAADAFSEACVRFRDDPWTWPLLAGRALAMAGPIAAAVGPGERGQRMFESLRVPFAASSQNDARLAARYMVGLHLDGEAPDRLTREALESFTSRNVPWKEPVLAARAACMARLGDRRAAEAARDLARFRAHREPDVGTLLEARP